MKGQGCVKGQGCMKGQDEDIITLLVQMSTLRDKYLLMEKTILIAMLRVCQPINLTLNHTI